MRKDWEFPANFPYAAMIKEGMNEVITAAKGGEPEGWIKFSHKEGIDLFRKKIPGQAIDAIKGEGFIPASPRFVVSCIVDDGGFKELDPMLKTSTRVRRYDSRTTMLHEVFHPKWPAQGRDFLTVGHWR